MSKQLTIRGVPEAVADRLTRLSAARGQGVNSTVLEILEAVVGALIYALFSPILPE